MADDRLTLMLRFWRWLTRLPPLERLPDQETLDVRSGKAIPCYKSQIPGGVCYDLNCVERIPQICIYIMSNPDYDLDEQYMDNNPRVRGYRCPRPLWNRDDP